MASRRDWLYRQLVTEMELDAAFAGLEAADRAIASDMLPSGIVRNAAVTQRALGANLTVDVSGLAVAYDQAGQRIAFGPAQNVSLATDSESVSTAVAGAGNEKWIALFLQFDRALSDPRVDGNGDTVNFVRDEGFRFVIVQGAEALIGNATRPALKTDAILLCDVRLINGQTQILTGDVSTTRRQDAVVGTGSTWIMRKGTLREAVIDLLADLNNHVGGTGYHSSTHVVNTGGAGAWLDETTNPEATVSAQLSKIVSDLSSKVSLTSGANKIGTAGSTQWLDASALDASTVMDAINGVIAKLGENSGTGTANGAGKVGCKARTAWLGGRANAAGSVFAAIDKIVTDLAVQTASDDGAERIGGQAVTGTPYSFAEGSVRSQLDAILTALNGHAALGSTDKHVVAADAYVSDTTTEIENFGLVGSFGNNATVQKTIAGLKNGDVVFVDFTAKVVTGAGSGTIIRLAEEDNANTHEITGTTTPIADALTTHLHLSGFYAMTADGACTIKIQGQYNTATNRPKIFGGCTLRVVVFRG